MWGKDEIHWGIPTLQKPLCDTQDPQIHPQKSPPPGSLLHRCSSVPTSLCAFPSTFSQDGLELTAPHLSAPRAGSVAFSLQTPHPQSLPASFIPLFRREGYMCICTVFQAPRTGIFTHYMFIHSTIHAPIPMSTTHPCIHPSSSYSLIPPSHFQPSIHEFTHLSKHT